MKDLQNCKELWLILKVSWITYLDSELIVEVLDLIVCLGEMLHRVRHQLLLLLLAGVRLLGQLKDKHQCKLMLAPVFRFRISVADPGRLSRIRIFSIPDPHQRI